MTAVANAKYSFDNLRPHTDNIRRRAKQAVAALHPGLAEAFEGFSKHFAAISEQPKTLERNVRMLLAGRFFNHIYGSIILGESGLYTEAHTCQRSALEVLAAYRLVSSDSDMAARYEQGRFPQPGEVRKRLEDAGYADEAKAIRDLYSVGSTIAHVTRGHERFNLMWKNAVDGEVHVGGKHDDAELMMILRFASAVMLWFIGDAVVTRGDS